MPESNSPSRNFRSGSWDLRRGERRKIQRSISFPDRRVAERRDEGLEGWLRRDEPEMTWIKPQA